MRSSTVCRRTVRENGETIEHIFEDFERVILPGITHWNHPRFLAYFANTSSPPAVLAELLAAALNANGLPLENVARRERNLKS